MCQECGCGLPAATRPHDAGAQDHEHDRDHDHSHDHDHDHDHGHSHSHPHSPSSTVTHAPTPTHAQEQDLHPARVISVQRALLARNERLAEQNRGFFRARGLLVLNVMSAPGSGKTTFVEQTARRLQGRLRTGVIVGDLATENDAARLRAAHIPVAPITTGTLCHLEAAMVARAADQLDTRALDLLIIENVGNLVCPASYDLGESLRVVLMSVTEGEDKPLKYPPLFHSANVAIVSKTDLAEAAGFDREAALAHLRRISHHAAIFEVSARTGHGMDAWCEFLLQRRREASP